MSRVLLFPLPPFCVSAPYFFDIRVLEGFLGVSKIKRKDGYDEQRAGRLVSAPEAPGGTFGSESLVLSDIFSLIILEIQSHQSSFDTLVQEQ